MSNNSSGTSNSETKDVEDIPVSESPRSELQMDKGLIPWMQCFGCSCLWMGTWGTVNSFGVFQVYYEERFPHQTASSISWIGSLQVALLMGLGIIIGPIFDAGYLRTLTCVGTFISILALMLTSICTQYWQILLTQGLLLGIGNGCLFIPSTAILPSYFLKKRSLAIGLAATGSAVGGVIFPIVFHQLQPKIGFGWTVRVIAFILLVVFIFPVLILRMRSQPAAIRRMFDIYAWKEMSFFLTGLGLFLVFLGVVIPLFYVQLFAIDKGIVDSRLAFYLLPLLNAGSVFGRIILPYIADRAGIYNTSIVCIAVISVLGFVWIAVHDTVGIVIFVLIYGFFYGGVASLCVSLVVPVTPNLSQFGTRMGMAFLVASLGLLFGNPIAGALSARGWISLQVFAGTVEAVAATTFISIKLLLYGLRFVRK